METRVTVLGHVQRAPNSRDRLFASVFGVTVDLVAAEKFNRLVVWSGRKCSDIPLNRQFRLVTTWTQMATWSQPRGLGVYIGN